MLLSIRCISDCMCYVCVCVCRSFSILFLHFFSFSWHRYAWRKSHITTVSARLLEVVLVSTFISILAFFVPLAVPSCHSDVNQDNETFTEFVQQFTCKNDGEYSETASMFLLPPTSTVRRTLCVRACVFSSSFI